MMNQSDASTELYSGEAPPSGKRLGSMPSDTAFAQARRIFRASSVWPPDWSSSRPDDRRGLRAAQLRRPTGQTEERPEKQDPRCYPDPEPGLRDTGSCDTNPVDGHIPRWCTRKLPAGSRTGARQSHVLSAACRIETPSSHDAGGDSLCRTAKAAETAALILAVGATAR